MIYLTRVAWAPDGDATFDDGTCILQLDIGDLVRLIAFKSTRDGDMIRQLSETLAFAEMISTTLRDGGMMPSRRVGISSQG
jgi:hypothetical protein